jgi:curved DNA-binding protein CbpA
MNYDFSAQQHQRHDQFDPYDTLNVPREADTETIRQAFRKLTRVYHPDRNRNNPNYNQGHYSRICAAYEILTDPRQRAAFDQQHAPTWNTLRDASRSQQAAVPQAPMSSGRFSVKQFNEQFEQRRSAINPNDRGYGDQMLPRVSEKEVEHGRQAASVQNLFGSATKVAPGTFNSRFEAEARTRRGSGPQAKAIMERSNTEPMGWAVGASGSGFSDISVYDGIIVDREREDFTKTDESTGLNYSDYMSGFSTFSEQLPEDHPYYQAESRDVERVYNERLSQISQAPERGHNMSFSQAEAALNRRREEQLVAEKERNREMVLRYRDYASDDLLPPPKSNTQCGRQTTSKKGAAQPSSSGPGTRGNRDPLLSNRMIDRQLDNVFR